MIIKKLFIANRGEIAARIARSAKKLGIQTVAITQKNQRKNFLVGWIDQYIEVEKETLKLYLDGSLMISLAKESGCDALHPGFGFLSENADFCQKVSNSGLIWIGPKSDAISKMASKEKARAIAISLKVPVIPGIANFSLSKDQLPTLCKEIEQNVGFPVLIKAALGGGGKGMRVSDSPSNLPDNLDRASSEALSSFGDGSLIVEKYLPSLRHVEVQVLCDQHGSVKTIGDRDCSIQRRHQKIIEEAPAWDLSDNLRSEMHTCAIRLSKEVNYISAGTVEYLVDGENFYFLEMNTRLQVEHPVTEEVFGIDLVSWQLKIAQGESIDSLNPISKGHSIEARIYAENPNTGFLPSTGRVHGFIPFTKDSSIRWEVGIDRVDEISGDFDPMIGKVISYGETRENAAKSLSHALSRTMISGPNTNIEFLSYLLLDKPFLSKKITTNYISENKDSYQNHYKEKVSTYKEEVDYLVSQLNLNKKAESSINHPMEIRAETAFRKNNISSKNRNNFELLIVDNVRYSSNLFNSGYFEGILKNNSSNYKNIVFQAIVSKGSNQKNTWIKIGGTVIKITKDFSNLDFIQKSIQGDGSIYAPVPGKVFKVNVKSGNTVGVGDVMIVLESMKMEFEIKNEKAGKIGEILVSIGDQVDSDQLLLKII